MNPSQTASPKPGTVILLAVTAAWVVALSACSAVGTGSAAAPAHASAYQPYSGPETDAATVPLTAADVRLIVASIPAAGSDTSVPDAATVFAEEPPPAAAPTAQGMGQDKAQAPPNAGLTPAQESTAMPMPGQANTHSTPSTKPAAP